MTALRTAAIHTSDGVVNSIDFARGKTVLLVGDSVDRGHLHHVCDQLGGQLEMAGAESELSPAYPPGDEHPPAGYVSPLDGTSEWPSYHQSRPFYCYVERIDLLLVNTFHFGYEPRDDFIEHHVHGHPPFELEDRVSHISVPLLESLGRKLNRSTTPDVVSITAGFWSPLRAAHQDELALNAALEGGAVPDEIKKDYDKWRPMPDQLAEWYESRTEQVLRHIGSLWADALHPPRLVWRTLHRTQRWTEIPATRVAQLDQITRAVVQRFIGESETFGLGSRQRLYVNTWGDKIDGLQYRDGFFRDPIHPGYELSFVFGNMLFQELKEEVTLRTLEARS